MGILLRPFIKHVDSYVRDDLEFLNHLPTQIKENEILITMDITSLYSNIDNNLGKEAIKYWLEKNPQDIHHRFEQEFLLQAMAIILENNNFTCNGKHYVQVSGTAMGTIFAPTYATLVLAYLEQKLYDNIEKTHGKNRKGRIPKSTKTISR